MGKVGILDTAGIRPCHTAAILSRETKKALFYHAKPRSGNHGGEAWRGKTKLFWSPGTIWPPCDKGELEVRKGFFFNACLNNFATCCSLIVKCTSTINKDLFTLFQSVRFYSSNNVRTGFLTAVCL